MKARVLKIRPAVPAGGDYDVAMGIGIGARSRIVLSDTIRFGV